jgi:hypothetical protein
MPDQTGWWTFDAETQTLINRVSGQRVCNESDAERSPANGTRLRFSYQDAEVRYPLLVRARTGTYGGGSVGVRA